MFDLISNLIRRLSQDAVDYCSRLLKTQFRTAFMLEESRHIVGLREQADTMERNGHYDLAGMLRAQADALAGELGGSASARGGDGSDPIVGTDSKAQIVLSANVLSGGHKALIPSERNQRKHVGRGRPRKNTPPTDK